MNEILLISNEDELDWKIKNWKKKYNLYNKNISMIVKYRLKILKSTKSQNHLFDIKNKKYEGENIGLI